MTKMPTGRQPCGKVRAASPASKARASPQWLTLAGRMQSGPVKEDGEVTPRQLLGYSWRYGQHSHVPSFRPPRALASTNR
jgi:hypothetical protein